MENNKKKFGNEKILLSHGAGGKQTRDLVRDVLSRSIRNPVLNSFDDAAEIKALMKKGERLAFTTDSFVVDPIFFPGGDIGRLSVCGTVNDLAMKGAKPLAISVSAIIEEGFEIEKLKMIADSIGKTAKEAGVFVACGDTKVVEKNKADKIFITTSGIGIIPKGVNISGKNARSGDKIIINGSMGDHGTAITQARNNFELKSKLKSDCAPLGGVVQSVLKVSGDVHVLRDPTRGGLATTLNEIAESSDIGIIIEEDLIPIKKEVRSICALLGLDPLYSANEGKFICILPERNSAKVLNKIKQNKYGKDAAVIGRVDKTLKGVWLKTSAGGLRPLLMLEGEQLPRIC